MDSTDTPLLGLSQRLPPSNVQAEQALLGALLANNKAYERVSEFLRNLQNNGRYVEKPELIEIKLAGASPQGIQRRLFEFSLNFSMKPNPDRQAAANGAAPAAAGAKKS